MNNYEITRFAQLFNDELTLDNLERIQLVNLCRFVGIPPFGTDAFLASRLRAHLARIKVSSSLSMPLGCRHIEQEQLLTVVSPEVVTTRRTYSNNVAILLAACMFMFSSLLSNTQSSRKCPFCVLMIAFRLPIIIVQEQAKGMLSSPQRANTKKACSSGVHNCLVGFW